MHLLDSARAAQLVHPLARQLHHVVCRKRSNLCVSADVRDPEACLALMDQVGPSICLIKTHVDTLDRVPDGWFERVQQLARQHDFLIFEDRKFADIGHTVKWQYGGGPFRIADWADITNAHALPGPGVVEGLAAVGMPQGRALLLLAQMSSSGNLLNAAYAQATLNMAEAYPDFVIGFIAQTPLNDDPRWLVFTPGIQFEAGTDTLHQQYRTPEDAIQRGSDIIIVGRGVYESDNPAQTAEAYRQLAWNALSAGTSFA